MSFLRRSRTSTPDEPKRTEPTIPGAMLITLRSSPRHHDTLVEAIESTGDANVYFSEELAYIRGKGVSLIRIQATGTSFVDPLYQRWQELQWQEAVPFEITLYVHNTEYVASIREHSPDEFKALIEQHAPKFAP